MTRGMLQLEENIQARGKELRIAEQKRECPECGNHLPYGAYTAICGSFMARKEKP